MKVDEYGFIIGGAESVTIMAGGDDSVAPRSKSVDDPLRSIQIPDLPRPSISTQRQQAQSQAVLRREAVWISLLDGGEDLTFRSKKIKSLCREGIPDSCRGRAWYALAGCAKLKQDGLYTRLTTHGHTPVYETIEKDVARCYPDHIMFRDPEGEGQKYLRNVLRAYSVFNPKVGYCQGMGMLVGLILMYLPPEDSFWLLVSVLANDGYARGFYDENLERFKSDAVVFESLLLRKARKLAKHLAKQDVVPLVYLPQWFLTLFTGTLPWASVLRVWDVFFCDGTKALFRIGLAIMIAGQNHIIYKCPSNSEIISYLLHLPPNELQADTLIKQALKVRLKTRKLQQQREQALH